MGYLCFLQDDDTKVVVRNPYWGQTRWIEARYPHVLSGPRNMFKFYFTLGYENKRCGRNYKLLRFIDFFIFKRWNEFFWYEIYDFESGLWTTLDVTPYWRIRHGGNVSLKGNTYFCVTKRKSGAHTDHINCFDYTSERFGPLLPLPFIIVGDRVTLSSVREEKVAVLCQHEDDGDDSFVIWITTMIEAEKVSWRKFLSFYPDLLPLPDDIGIQLTFETFYFDEVKKVAMVFGTCFNGEIVCIINQEGDCVEVVDLQESTGEEWWWNWQLPDPRVCCYVPSLVQIKQPRGEGQRERQSDLEKLRYDEMLSKLAFLV